jgi:hypothetical protein
MEGKAVKQECDLSFQSTGHASASQVMPVISNVGSHSRAWNEPKTYNNICLLDIFFPRSIWSVFLPRKAVLYS